MYREAMLSILEASIVDACRMPLTTAGFDTARNAVLANIVPAAPDG